MFYASLEVKRINHCWIMYEVIKFGKKLKNCIVFAEHDSIYTNIFSYKISFDWFWILIYNKRNINWNLIFVVVIGSHTKTKKLI